MLYPLLVLIYHYIMLFFDFIIDFALKSTLSDMNILTQVSFHLHLHEISFSISSHLVCVFRSEVCLL